MSQKPVIEITSVKTALCDLEVQQKEKEVFTVRIDQKEQSLCWACLRRIAMMQFRKVNAT